MLPCPPNHGAFPQETGHAPSFFLVDRRFCGCDPRAVGSRAALCHLHAGRAGAAGGLHPFRLCQPASAQGRRDHLLRGRVFRQPQPVHPEKPAHHGTRHDRHDLRQSGLRAADAAQHERGLFALWPPRRHGRHERRPQVDRVPSRSEGEMVGRRAGHARRRAVHLRCLHRQGPPALFGSHEEGRQAGEDRRPQRQVHLQRPGGPGISAHHRDDADRAEACVRQGDF